jgi:membrane peptidoglycan carboxypeptidase
MRHRRHVAAGIALFCLTFLLTLGGSLVARTLASSAAEGRRAASPAVRPDVAASAEAAALPAPAPDVPDEVLARVPATREVLSGETALTAGGADPGATPLAEVVPSPPSRGDLPGPLRVEYALDPDLERRVFDILESRGVRLGHVVLMDPASGRVLAYASTDVERFPPGRTYPAASLIKVVTAAAALHHDRERTVQPCRFLGSPYALTPERVDPPRQGKEVTLERALATSNNQCMAQLAVHVLGATNMVDAITRFGFLRAPAPGHSPGRVDPGVDTFDLGKLGCGLSGTWITPLHAAQLGATLARGQLVEPWWVARVTDASGRSLALPRRRAPRQVMTPELAAEMRTMLIETTVNGTARRGFRNGSGGPLLGAVQVSGKTGSLSGTDPAGRYEWFAGVAPANDPKVAIAVVVVQQQRVWVHASRVAGEVLQAYFCDGGACGGGNPISRVSASPPARAKAEPALKRSARSRRTPAVSAAPPSASAARKSAAASRPKATAKKSARPPAKVTAKATARPSAKAPAKPPTKSSAKPKAKPTASDRT